MVLRGGRGGKAERGRLAGGGEKEKKGLLFLKKKKQKDFYSLGLSLWQRLKNNG
jgi:hypothetical protein